jgi:hypothetical protein
MGIFASDTRQYFARKTVATHEKPSISFEDAKANLAWTKTDRGSDLDLNKPHSRASISFDFLRYSFTNAQCLSVIHRHVESSACAAITDITLSTFDQAHDYRP